MNDFAALARLIQAIEPWRARLVIVGGWAHRLYRFHPMANVPTYQPLLTRDTDLAFANQAPLEGDIKSALAHAGFIEELSGTHQPPVTRYTLGDDDAGFYAEFLTPLQGSEVRRDGRPDATVTKAGITAQKLRYLDCLIRPGGAAVSGDALIQASCGRARVLHAECWKRNPNGPCGHERQVPVHAWHRACGAFRQ